MSKEFKAHETKDYIGRCFICNQNLTRNELRYEKGKGFHTDCYEKNKANILTTNPEITNEGSRLKVQLTLLKNLQVRNTPSIKAKPKKVKKKSIKTKKKKVKAKKRSPKGKKPKRKGTGKKKKRVIKRKKVVRRKSKRKIPAKRKSSKRRKRV